MVGSMEDIFDASLNSIKEMVEIRNYDSCVSRTIDLTTVSLYSSYEAGLLISEVLEDVFGQVGNTMRVRVVDDAHQDSISNDLRRYLDDILDSYKKNDKNDLFTALMKVRSTATRFYYYGFDCPRRPETHHNMDG